MQVKEASLEGSCKTDLHGKDECTGKATIKWGPKDDGGGDKQQFANLMASALNLTGSLPDAAMFAIDTTGSTIPYPSTGTVLVKLVRSSDSNVLATRTFPWIRSGAVIHFADPDEVNEWAYTYAADADTFEYDTGYFPSDFAGYQTMKLTQKYEGIAQASDTTTVYGGRDCTRYPSPRLCRDD